MGKTSITQIVIGSVLTAAGVLLAPISGGLSGGLIGTGLGMIAGGVAGALGPKNLAAQQAHLLSNGQGPNQSVPVVYGTTRLGVLWTDFRTDPDDDDILYAVGTVCLGSEGGTGIEDITAIYFDDDAVVGGTMDTTGTLSTSGVSSEYADHLSYAIHLGTDAQSVNATLASVFPTEYPSTSKAAGVAYIVLKLTYNEEVYPAGLPTVTVGVQGQKLYDPRTTLTAHSTNPALAVLDYLTSDKYGCGVPLAEIDTASFEDAANYCDETVNTTAYNATRFLCNGVLDPAVGRQANLQALLSSCRGELVYQSGTFRLLIRQPTAAETFELTEDNIVGDWEFLRAGEAPNSVTVSFVDPSQEYQVREVSWPEAGQTNNFLTADNSIPSNVRVELPFTTNYYIAQQIGMVALREAREDVTVALTAKEEALKLQVGDVVNLTHSTPGWTDKAFWVQTVGILPNAEVRLVLREYDANAYSLDTQNTDATVPGTNIPALLTPQDCRILAFLPVRDASGGATMTYFGRAGDDVDEVWLTFDTFDQPVILEDPAQYTEDYQRNLVVLVPAADKTFSYTFTVPDEGTVLYGMVRPYHVRRSGTYLSGDGVDFHIDPLPKSQPIVNRDDSDDGETGYWWVKLQDRGLAVSSVTMGTQRYRTIVDGQTPTRDSGDTSVVTGAVMGADEYEGEVSLSILGNSWIWFDVTYENGYEERILSPALPVNAQPWFLPEGPRYIGTAIFLNAVNFKSVNVARTDGGGTWEVDREVVSQVDVGALDDSGNAGLSAGNATYAITLYSDAVADRDANTLEATTNLTVYISGSSATHTIDVMTASAPAVGDTIGTVQYQASSSTPDISTRVRYRTDGGLWGAWTSVAGASPSPAPTTLTSYSIPSLPTRVAATGGFEQHFVEVEVEGTLESGATEYDVETRSFSYYTED